MVDSGADHSVIRDGIFSTKYYEPTNEKLVTANDSPLRVKGKLTKTSICNDKICFKHQFIIVDDLNSDVILGISFLTQIYPFWVDSKGLGTKIMGQKILFKFITPIQYKELNTLQTNSIYHSVNLIQTKNIPAWSDKHTQVVKQIKEKVHSLPCLCIPHAFMIVETDASDIGYGGILKQKFQQSSHKQLIRFHSGVWLGPQKSYSTIKKEILSIVQCISKFQDDLLNKKIPSPN